MKTFSQKEKFFWERSVQNFVVRGGLWRDGGRAETAETEQPGRAEGGQGGEAGEEPGLWAGLQLLLPSSGPTTAPDLRLAAHCSRLTLPTQTLTPSANTNKATYLHCLTKVNSPVRAQALPSPSRSGCWAKGMHGVIFFGDLFPPGRISGFKWFQLSRSLIVIRES